MYYEITLSSNKTNMSILSSAELHCHLCEYEINKQIQLKKHQIFCLMLSFIVIYVSMKLIQVKKHQIFWLCFCVSRMWYEIMKPIQAKKNLILWLSLCVTNVCGYSSAASNNLGFHLIFEMYIKNHEFWYATCHILRIKYLLTMLPSANYC